MLFNKKRKMLLNFYLLINYLIIILLLFNMTILKDFLLYLLIGI